VANWCHIVNSSFSPVTTTQKVGKRDDLVVDLLRLNGNISYQSTGGGRSSTKARVVKDNGASENNIGWKFIHEMKRQEFAQCTKMAGWMIVEMANINAQDGINKCQGVQLKLRLSASYVYEAQFTSYKVKGIHILQGKR
jgi:hypothetical protein